jgi:hypothetical protein
MCRLENKFIAPLWRTARTRGANEPLRAFHDYFAAVSSTMGAAPADFWIDSMAFTADAFAVYISLVAMI